MAVLEQLPHLGQEDAAERHELLNLLPPQIQGILQKHYHKVNCEAGRADRQTVAYDLSKVLSHKSGAESGI